MRRINLLTCLIISTALLAAAATIDYDVTVNTSPVNGVSGFLDFTYAGGLPTPPPGTVTISSFSSDGALGVPVLTGNAAGTLTAPVTLDNTGFPPSDYYTPFQFGTHLRFRLTFSGLAVDTPDGVSGTSTFAFSMLDGANSPLLVPTPLPLDNPGGFAFTADLDNAGRVSLMNFSNAVSIEPVINAVPEPSTFLMLISAGGLIGAARRRRRERSI